MVIQLNGTACIAVNQNSMYAIIEGSQSLSGDDGLFTLIKAEYPTITPGNNTWTVFSTMPIITFWTEDYDAFGEIPFATCSVDRIGVFTVRLMDSSGKRYDPMAPKAPQYQTCSSDSNGPGEWKQVYLVTSPVGTIRQRLIIRPEFTGSESGNSGGYNNGDEMAIFQSLLGVQGPPTILFARSNKEEVLNNITSDDLSSPVMLVNSFNVKPFVDGSNALLT